MPYEDMGDAYMNHAGGGMYGTGPRPQKLEANRTNDDRVVHHVSEDKPKSASVPSEVPPLEDEKPSVKQLAVVSNWWFDKRDRIAVMFDVEPNEVPAAAVWFLDIDYVATQRDIDRAKQIAKELGFEA